MVHLTYRRSPRVGFSICRHVLWVAVVHAVDSFYEPDDLIILSHDLLPGPLEYRRVGKVGPESQCHRAETRFLSLVPQLLSTAHKDHYFHQSAVTSDHDTKVVVDRGVMLIEMVQDTHRRKHNGSNESCSRLGLPRACRHYRCVGPDRVHQRSVCENLSLLQQGLQVQLFFDAGIPPPIALFLGSSVG